MLSEWIDSYYLNKNIISSLRKKFLAAEPFPHLALTHFFQEEKLSSLIRALRTEQFYRKEADLFQFSQTNDFKSTENRTIREFRAFLSSPEFCSYLSHMTTTRLKAHRIDMSGTLYKDTDYLLCHDDRLQGRNIAYSLYLSSLTAKQGGALSFFESKNKKPTRIVKRIIPTGNTFTFFKVSPRSFHQVEEVLSPKQRLALSGWFHD